MIGGLTKSETVLFLSGLTRTGKLNQETYERVMAWAENAKLDSDLLVLIFERYVELDVDPEGILRFVPTP